MANYSRILLATDLHDDNADVVSKAKELAAANSAELFVIHVNEPIAVAYAADGFSWNDQIVGLEAMIRKESETKMKALVNQLGLDDAHSLLREGKPSSEIHDACDEKGIDLVVIGTHGQAGLQLLLGSTASSVLPGPKCDVLCVRVGS